MRDNPFSGCQIFIGRKLTTINEPIKIMAEGCARSKSFSASCDAEPLHKVKWDGNDLSFDVSAEREVTPDHIVDSLFKQAINDAIDEAYRVGINIAPTRLPRKAKKWYTRQTKRNQRGMAQYLHILRTNHKDLGECVVGNVKRTMEGVEVELTGKVF